MRTFSKHLFALLLGTVIITSCSRPVAYFQPTAREQFKSAQPETVAATVPTQMVEAAAIDTPAPAVPSTAVDQMAQTKQAVSQLEAYVRNDNKLASNKKLTKRMDRLNELVATTEAKAPVMASATSARKATLIERMMLKRLDKKIKNHVAPDNTKVMNSNVRLGLIIGLIGLVLWLLGGTSVLAVIGIIGFIVGLVLILLGVINT